VPRRTAAHIGDHIPRRGAIIGKALNYSKRLIERLSAGDPIALDERLVAPAIAPIG